MAKCESWSQRMAILVYSLGALTLFGVSSLYHRITWSSEKRAVWRKLDHSAIYLMIAGTFTPFAALKLPASTGQQLLWIIWSIAAVGVVQSIFFVNLPKMISALIYIVAGYTILPYLGELKNSIGSTNYWLILAGGISYSLGALAYGLKRPILNPKVFSYHEVFHLFVNLGAIFHYLAVYSVIN